MVEAGGASNPLSLTAARGPRFICKATRARRNSLYLIWNSILLSLGSHNGTGSASTAAGTPATAAVFLPTFLPACLVPIPKLGSIPCERRRCTPSIQTTSPLSSAAFSNPVSLWFPEFQRGAATTKSIPNERNPDEHEHEYEHVGATCPRSSRDHGSSFSPSGQKHRCC